MNEKGLRRLRLAPCGSQGSWIPGSGGESDLLRFLREGEEVRAKCTR